MALPQGFQGFAQSSRGLFEGDRESIFNAFKLLVTVLALAGVVAAAATSGSSDGGKDSSEEDGSSRPGELPPYEYEQPHAEVQVWLTELQAELAERVISTRLEHDASAIALPEPERQGLAQSKAEYNAATGTQAPTEENIAMLQDSMDVAADPVSAGAAAHRIIQKFMASTAHKEVLLAPDYLYFAVGTAYADGKVYVVIQFDDGVSPRAAEGSSHVSDS